MPASTVPYPVSHILRPLIFRDSALLSTRNRMQYYGLVVFSYPNKYLCFLLNACAKKLIVLLMEGIQLQIELSSEKY